MGHYDPLIFALLPFVRNLRKRIFKCPNWTVDFRSNGEGVLSKIALTYMNENGVLRGCFRKRFTAYLQN
jgi:hypothetical protein